MNPALSQFGEQVSHLTGVRAIMQDIVATLRQGQGQEFINLSAGNPVILPEVEQLWRNATRILLDGPDYGEVVCRYGSSQGYGPLIQAVCEDFNRRYGLTLTERNLLITPGSQALYFYAANAFAGYTRGGLLKRIVLPLSPDYTGYGGITLHPEALLAYQPTLEVLSLHRFKYRPDFTQLKIGPETGLVLFSRPCNPTGNVLTAGEVERLANLAAPHGIPVFVDSAYGPPYPALTFGEDELHPVFAPNIVHCLSLSKAGLPGERLGIAIGDEAIIRILESFQTNLCIHASRYGQAIAAEAIRSGALAEISAQVICPYYRHQFQTFEAALEQAMPEALPWLLHKGEGAIFAWLWLPDLPMTDWELYQHLKAAGVIVVPGSSFFPGLPKSPWLHPQQCLRISLTASQRDLERGAQRLAAVVEQVTRHPEVHHSLTPSVMGPD